MNTKCSIFTSVSMLAPSFLIESSSKLLVTRTGIKARTSSNSGLWFPWPIYMFFEMRFDLGKWTPVCNRCLFGLLVLSIPQVGKRYVRLGLSALVKTEKTLVWYARNNLNIFFVIARPCMVSTLLRPHSIVRYFNRV